MALPARVAVDGGLDADARLLNVGLGGACVDVPGAVAVGTELTLHVTTPVLWDPLVVRGKVVWADDRKDGHCRLGLRFDHERSRVIRALLELLSADGYE
jgi:hypothetical protein